MHHLLGDFVGDPGAITATPPESALSAIEAARLSTLHELEWILEFSLARQDRVRIQQVRHIRQRYELQHQVNVRSG